MAACSALGSCDVSISPLHGAGAGRARGRSAARAAPGARTQTSTPSAPGKRGDPAGRRREHAVASGAPASARDSSRPRLGRRRSCSRRRRCADIASAAIGGGAVPGSVRALLEAPKDREGPHIDHEIVVPE